MHPDPRVLLADVEQAGEAIERFTEGMDQAAYASDFRTQAAVERKFEIIGEALNILSTSNPELAERVPRIRKNRLPQPADPRLFQRYPRTCMGLRQKPPAATAPNRANPACRTGPARRMNKVTADEVKARNYNLDIKNPHMSQDDHEELLLSLNAAEAEAAALREQLKAASAEALLQ